MTARLTDSQMYAHLWGTAETRAIFAEDARLRCWIDILVALAQAQAELGYIPAGAADAIRSHARLERLDLAAVARETRRTGHSTLGLIRVLRDALPDEAREHVYYGATVQDVTDTWTVLAIRQVGAIAWRDLRAVEHRMLELAIAHRDTVMAGRTHGQVGAPITFGWKVASWADEVRRHTDRLRSGADRWLVGQLGGAVGTAAFFGARALELRRRFCDLLGLGDPGISWLAARDRIAEFGVTLALIAGTLARVGNEIYALARTEIGEVREAADPAAVSSITMPHKRNPERAEHLVTLSRLVQAQAQVLLAGAVHEHERDGRAWKAEWVAFPEICLLTATALTLARDMLDDLEVDAAGMTRNIAAHRDHLASERLLTALTARAGKHEAQGILQHALAAAGAGGTSAGGTSFTESLLHSTALRAHLSDEDLRAALTAPPDTGAAGAMIDIVVARARAARSTEPARWP
jgi:adenylosuccinate lyase